MGGWAKKRLTCHAVVGEAAKAEDGRDVRLGGGCVVGDFFEQRGNEENDGEVVGVVGWGSGFWREILTT